MSGSTQFDNLQSVAASSTPRRCPLQSLRNAPLPFDCRIVPALDPLQARQWDAITSGQSVFLQRAYLQAIQSSSQDIELRYALFHDGPRLVGVACFQVVEFVGRSPAGDLDSRSALAPIFARWLGFDRETLACKLVVCGNALASGGHGFVFAPHVDPTRAVAALTSAATQFQNELAGHTDLVGTLFKEFTHASHAYPAGLQDQRYIEIKTEPSMVLWMDPAWQTFDDYLASLVSKYRVKAKRAYTKSSRLQSRALSSEDVLEHQARIHALHDGVTQRADYRLGRLCTESLAALRSHLDETFILQGYFLDGELVGFLSGFENGETLEAHVVGIDYDHNQEHAIYPRMLEDYIRIALERRLKFVNYGRTATEIKSTLGAQPVHTSVYFRHRSCVPNGMLRFLSRRFSPPPPVLRAPFKQTWYELHAGVLPAVALLEG